MRRQNGAQKRAISRQPVCVLPFLVIPMTNGAMRVLTDDRALALTFFPDARADCGAVDRHLHPFERALIEALGGTGWACELRVDEPFWWTVVVRSFSAVSQFDALDRVLGAATTLPGPVACVALSGNHFHGQRGRAWAAARGNLHMSAAVPVRLHAEHVGVGLSMLPAVAAVDAIADVTDGAVVPGIKWVNDILIGERKVGGVLTAAHSTGRAIDDVVWGIGINVEVAPPITATPVVRATTSLRAQTCGAGVTVERVFRALLASIARRHAQLKCDGGRALLPAYRNRSVVIGRPVQVWKESACLPDDPGRWGLPFAEGVVADIGDDLSLRLHDQALPVTDGRLALRAQ